MCIETSLGLYFVHCSDVIHGNLSSTSYQVNSDFHVKVGCNLKEHEKTGSCEIYFRPNNINLLVLLHIRIVELRSQLVKNHFRVFTDRWRLAR